MAIVGIVPAAGYAVRLQPLDRSKELLEIAGRPVIDYLVERMGAGGAEEIRVVTRPEKEDIVSYAQGIGAAVVLAHPPTINDSFVAGLSGLRPEDIALLGFPDSLWQPPDGYRTLVDAVGGGSEMALGLFEAPGVIGSDYLRLDDSGGIADIEIKPLHPASDWIWGCAAARVRSLEGLEQEEWPSAHVNRLLRRKELVKGIPLSAEYIDIGTPASLRQATAAWQPASS